MHAWYKDRLVISAGQLCHHLFSFPTSSSVFYPVVFIEGIFFLAASPLTLSMSHHPDVNDLELVDRAICQRFLLLLNYIGCIHVCTQQKTGAT